MQHGNIVSAFAMWEEDEGKYCVYMVLEARFSAAVIYQQAMVIL